VEEIKEPRREFWDAVVAGFEVVHPLNAFGWGKVREVDGWRPTYLIAKRGDMISGAIMILTKSIPGTRFSLMYAPKGPVWNPSDSETLNVLMTDIRARASKERAIFLRIDPHLIEDTFRGQRDPFLGEGFIHLKHRWTFWNSPRDVSRIDLSTVPDEAGLFQLLDRDARRCVRKANKEGLIIKAADSVEDLKTFYNIFKEFSVTKGFMSRGYSYQQRLWYEFIVRGHGRLFLGIYQGQIIGGLICLLFAQKCLAMHMATPYKYHGLHAYYAYLWESIRWAKSEGCSWYSFRGVGTTPTQERFKRKFGPQVVALVGYYDIPFYPALYRLFSNVEFEVIPRSWRALMSLRHGYHQTLARLRGHTFGR
jgi:peptidoglycan pentaglycine glycine transferase (the first glycine)